MIRAEEYPGGNRDNPNPVILAYNGSHYEWLDSCTNKEDDIKAINLVESVTKGEYNLTQSDIQQMSRITRIKRDTNISKENTTKAKVNKEGKNSTKNHTCKVCTTEDSSINRTTAKIVIKQYGVTQHLMNMQNNMGTRKKSNKCQRDNKHPS